MFLRLGFGWGCFIFNWREWMVVRIWAQIWKWMILRTRICDWHFGGEARLKGEGWGCKVGGNVFYLGAFHLKPQLIGWLRRKDSNWKRLRGWVNYRLLNLGSNWSLLMQFGWPFQKDLERRIATGIFWLVFFFICFWMRCIIRNKAVWLISGRALLCQRVLLDVWHWNLKENQ